MGCRARKPVCVAPALPSVCRVKHARRPSRAAPVESKGQQSETGCWWVVWLVRLEEYMWEGNGA